MKNMGIKIIQFKCLECGGNGESGHELGCHQNDMVPVQKIVSVKPIAHGLTYEQMLKIMDEE